MKIDMSAAKWDTSPSQTTGEFVSIWPKGLINFSTGATSRYDLTKEDRKVLVGYIEDKNLLLFKIVDGDTPGAVRLIARQKGAVAQIRGTLERFGISFTESTVRYPIERVEGGGDAVILAAKINEGMSVKKTRKG